jgi:hypothetical protein
MTVSLASPKLNSRIGIEMRYYCGPNAPTWSVAVEIPFLTLLASGIGVRASWRIAQGAKVSPFDQSNVLQKVKIFRWRMWVAGDLVREVVTLPIALWGV